MRRSAGYDYPDYASWHANTAANVAITAGTGKQFWLDEGGAGPESFRNSSAYGTYVGMFHAAVINGGVSTTLPWLFQDQYYTWPLEVRPVCSDRVILRPLPAVCGAACAECDQRRQLRERPAPVGLLLLAAVQHRGEGAPGGQG